MEETRDTMLTLNASNYSICKPRIEDILYSQNLHDIINGDEAKGDDEDKEWERLALLNMD